MLGIGNPYVGGVIDGADGTEAAELGSAWTGGDARPYTKPSLSN
ncbi:MAG: hypothetical protein WBV41_10655 [Terriglobales bacterium]